MAKSPKEIESFDLPPGRWVARKEVVDNLCGQGWDGEVYEVIEKKNGGGLIRISVWATRPRHRAR
jgi:hypothetical protein